jgi:sulfatase modifying factor 1
MAGRRLISGLGSTCPAFVAVIVVGVIACGRSSSPVPSGVSAVLAEPNGSSTGSVIYVTNAIVPAATAGVAAEAPEDAACPDGMILVEGEYCPNVEQTCLEWMDPPGDRYAHFRCKRYKAPAVCKGARVHERFCIDEKERTEPGSDLPRNHMSWTSATKLCEADGARLCKTREWQFACEGEEMLPYPYGWERDSKACNVDVMHGLGRVGRLVDHRTPASAHPACVSPFGVHDMAGNVDEWATVEGARKGKREVMKGSWWLPGRHACRSFQGGHGPLYGGTESGARCCKDAPP